MQKTRFIIMHGTYGTPESGFRPWLRDELIKLGHEVLMPQFPTHVDQTTEEWLKVLEQVAKPFSDDLILIGHSSAPLVICAKLQELDSPIKAVVFVAPFYGELGVPNYDEANRNFNNYYYDWKKVKKGAKQFFIYRGDNDLYVPEKQGKYIAMQLGVKETLIKDGGHLNTESGFGPIPQILTDLKNYLDEQQANN